MPPPSIQARNASCGTPVASMRISATKAPSPAARLAARQARDHATCPSCASATGYGGMRPSRMEPGGGTGAGCAAVITLICGALHCGQKGTPSSTGFPHLWQVCSINSKLTAAEREMQESGSQEIRGDWWQRKPAEELFQQASYHFERRNQICFDLRRSKPIVGWRVITTTSSCLFDRRLMPPISASSGGFCPGFERLAIWHVARGRRL